jgi:chromosomal replication initiation ATPase DnaA
MQLNLNIIPRLPYTPENFTIHSGAAEAYDSFLSVIKTNGYSIMWLQADARSGKTHFSVRMVKDALDLHKYPRLIEGKNFAEFLAKDFAREEFQDDQVFIVDDSETYFETIMPGGSGSFVNFIEHLRQKSAHVVFISARNINSFSCDDHILSRLKAGLISAINSPSGEDMPALIRQMSRQRGLSLTDKRVEYLSKRMRREIPYLENYLDRVSHLSSVLSRSLTRPVLANAL